MVLFLTSCGTIHPPGETTVGISAGTVILNSAWVGDGALIDFTVKHELDNGVFFEYGHTSNLRSGWPFNDNPENNIDRISIGKTFKIKSLSK